ncbi:facilitated trehalose transporter Tret1-like [Cylas formicarius]|uniref:facilitated trehalose transporter Tret1-like n=1 Tax=Cylas formicarius TaxID=197179 RepID=UPI00295878D7|nr:facilitated trehalose transporter Tret1-like [Cylas formicarius]
MIDKALIGSIGQLKRDGRRECVSAVRCRGMSKIVRNGPSGTKIYQYVAAVTVNLGIVCSEMHYGWPSPSLPILTNGTYSFTISQEEGSWLAVAPLIGAIFGAAVTGFVVDIFGRKRLIVLSSVPFTASWLFIAVAPSSVLMFVARFVAGMTDGLSFTAVPMYLGEIAEPKIRGLIASICPLCILFGYLLINVLGSYLPIDTTAYVAVSVPILLLVTFVWMPESPYFYVMKGRVSEARRSLQKFRGRDDVSAELDRISEAVREQNARRGHFLDLVRVRSNRKALIIALGVRGIQQLSGTSAIMFFCKQVFEESRDFLPSSVGTIVYFSVHLVLSGVASFVVDVSGRRPLLIFSVVGTAVSLFLNGSYLYVKERTDVDTSGFNFLPMVALLMYVVFFSAGLQIIPLLIMGELFPTNVKAFALCVMDVYFSVIVTCISKFFYWSSMSFGMHVPFFAFGCCCVVGLAFILFTVPETKGKTLEDIQNELKGEK